MRCQWQSYLKLLPQWLKEPVNRLSANTLTDLRLRLGAKPELVFLTHSVWLDRIVTRDDINFCINAATQYSPWTASSTAMGFITAPGGHRLGLSGISTSVAGLHKGFSSVTSLCIRVARDVSGIASSLAHIHSSILMIGAPGSGKTTLLRDLIRQYSEIGDGSVAVVDERSELFPVEHDQFSFFPGRRTDVLSGCFKADAIVMMIRCMGPSVIAVDEITTETDCEALLKAAWCGVRIFATAHAGSREELFNRVVYKPLLDANIFDTLVVLRPDKSWRLEKMYR